MLDCRVHVVIETGKLPTKNERHRLLRTKILNDVSYYYQVYLV